MFKTQCILIFLSFLFISQLTAQCVDLNYSVDGPELKNTFRNHKIGISGSLRFEGLYFGDENPDDKHDTILSIPFTSGLWMGGFSETDNSLKFAASTYNIAQSRDFIRGPWTSDNVLNEELCAAYSRGWKISSHQIRKLRDDFLGGALELSNIPINILEWPARGNIHFDEPIPIERDLAPFHDYNDDGIYNPLDGDYPIALEESRNFIPFEFMFTVYHDNTYHTLSNGEPVHMEVHQMDYLINCEEVLEGNTAVFTRLKLVYHGDEDLRDFNVSTYDNNNLGCDDTDHIGCNPETNLSYVYNRDGMEIAECPSGANPGFDQTIYAKVSYNHDLNSFIYFDRLGSPVNSPPASAIQYYNYTNAQWKDGSPLTYGGEGYDTTSTDVTRHIFPDLPTDTSGWSMQNNEYNYRGMSTVSTHWKGDLQTGDELIIDFSDFVYIDKSAVGLEMFEGFENAVANLKQQFQRFKDGSFMCNEISSLSHPEQAESLVIVYPNPVINQLVIELDPDSDFQEILLIDPMGKKRIHQKITDTRIDMYLGDLPTGVYFLQFRDSKNELFAKKIQVIK